jgi:hypothetical protein
LRTGLAESLLFVSTSKDCAFAVLDTSQIAIGHTRPSQSVAVFTSLCLIPASNVGRSRSSGFSNSPRPQLPASNSNCSQQLKPCGYLTHSLTDCLQTLSRLTELRVRIRLNECRFTANLFVLAPSHLEAHDSISLLAVLLITSRYRSNRKHRFSLAVHVSLPSNGCCLVVCFAVVV